MADRNVDRIKELELELGRWRKKAADQQKELARLSGRLKECEAGAAQLCRAADGVLAETALKFGEKADGGFRISIPATSVLNNAQNYEVSTGRDKEGESYVVFVKKKPLKN